MAQPWSRSPSSSWLTLALIVSAAAGAQARPNIVFVILDDIGVDRVGAYSPESSGPTPQLDALAAQGVRFGNFWGMPNCSPFRASALTGLPVRGHFVGGPIDPKNPRRARGLDPTLDTIPKRLAPLGYRSEAIGKWHLAGEPDFTPRHPLLAGFDHHAGTLGNPGALGGSYRSFDKCVDGLCAPVEDRYLTSDTTDDAITALSGSEPFFLWIGYNAAHKPLHLPPDSLHSFGDIPCPRYDHSICHQALVEALDSELGRLFAAIDWNDTTVVIAADNGTPNTSLDLEASTLGKGTVYDAGLHVPLIVRGAAVAPEARGSVATGLTQTTDLFATLLALAGIEAETPYSKSFAHMLSDPNAASRRPWQYVERYAPNGPAPDPALRHHRVAATQHYKLVIRSPRPTAGIPELYDRFGFGDRVDLYSADHDSEQREALAYLLDVMERGGAIPAHRSFPVVWIGVALLAIAGLGGLSLGLRP